MNDSERNEARERQSVRPLTEPEVAITILDEILGYPDLRSLREAVRRRNPNLSMEDRMARARILASEIPGASMRALLDRLGGPGYTPVGSSKTFAPFSEIDEITWTQRLVNALFTVAIMDPERDPDALIDAICDQILHLSGWRGVRLYVADHENLTLTALRDFRVRPLIDGRPAPQGTIVRDRMQITQELSRSIDESHTHVEGWVYWNKKAAVIKTPDDAIIKGLSRKIHRDSYTGKTTIFQPLHINLRTGDQDPQPIGVIASGCVPGEEDAALSWLEPASPFLDVVGQQLVRWVRYNLSRRQAQADLRTLSNRELEMLTCIGDGLSTEKTATLLGISVQTVKTHRRRLREKLGIRNEAELVKLAIQTGLTSSA